MTRLHRSIPTRQAALPAVLLILLVAAGLTLPHVAHAQGAVGFLLNLVSPIVSIVLIVVDMLLTITMWLLGIIMSLAGMFVDFLLSVRTLAGAPFVAEGWRITRDALNFVFILILLVIAFSTIAGIETYGMRKLLPVLLTAALLVNFSLAIAGGFLQVANVLARQALAPLGSMPGCDATITVGTGVLAPLPTAGLDVPISFPGGIGKSLSCHLAKSGAIDQMYKFGPSKIIKLTLGEAGVRTFEPSGGFTRLLDKEVFNFDRNLSSVISAATAVFFVGLFTVALIVLAAMLTVRVAVLIILLILAPAPFVFLAVPRASAWAEKWWSTFIQYTFFLPAMVFFLVQGIKLVRAAGGVVSQLRMDENAAFGALLNTPGLRPLLLGMFNAVFTSTFMIVSVFVAKALGIFGADTAREFARRVTTGAAWYGGVVPGKVIARGAGATAGAGARGVGRLATAIPGGAATLGGLRRAGRFAQRVATGATGAEQIEAQQKAVKGYSSRVLKQMMARGHAGAAAELLERGELDSEAEFQRAISLAPYGSALREKLERAYGTKFAVSGNKTGVTQKDIETALGPGGTGLSPAQLGAIAGKAPDIRKSLRRAKEEDIGKKETQMQIRAAIAAARHQVFNLGETDVGKLAVDLTPGKLRAYAASLDTEGQDELQTFLSQLSTHPVGPTGQGILTGAQAAAARRVGYIP